MFLDKVTNWVDFRNQVDVIYLEFAKAFDKGPHQRLLWKLHKYWVHEQVYLWIADWLRSRFQRLFEWSVFFLVTSQYSGVP